LMDCPVSRSPLEDAIKCLPRRQWVIFTTLPTARQARDQAAYVRKMRYGQACSRGTSVWVCRP
jgi:hypothetical protein